MSAPTPLIMSLPVEADGNYQEVPAIPIFTAQAVSSTEPEIVVAGSSGASAIQNNEPIDCETLRPLDITPIAPPDPLSSNSRSSPKRTASPQSRKQTSCGALRIVLILITVTVATILIYGAAPGSFKKDDNGMASNDIAFPSGPAPTAAPSPVPPPTTYAPTDFFNRKPNCDRVDYPASVGGHVQESHSGSSRFCTRELVMDSYVQCVCACRNQGGTITSASNYIGRMTCTCQRSGSCSSAGWW